MSLCDVLEVQMESSNYLEFGVALLPILKTKYSPKNSEVRANAWNVQTSTLLKVQPTNKGSAIMAGVYIKDQPFEVYEDGKLAAEGDGNALLVVHEENFGRVEYKLNGSSGAIMQWSCIKSS